MIDNATNRVCAHVLAFSDRNNTAYIAPMDVLLDDISRTLKASVMLPPYPPSVEAKSTSAVAGSTGYSPLDTPPPSPPLATSPEPPSVRSMERLSLLDNIAMQNPPVAGTTGALSSSSRLVPNSEMVNKDVGASGESSTAMKRRSNGIQAKG